MSNKEETGTGWARRLELGEQEHPGNGNQQSGEKIVVEGREADKRRIQRRGGRVRGNGTGWERRVSKTGWTESKGKELKGNRRGQYLEGTSIRVCAQKA